MKEGIFIKSYTILDENFEIEKVRLISDESNEIMSLDKALKSAKTEGLDLVLINDSGDIPVCKIMNYQKFIYQEKKAEKKKDKNQHSSNKEFQFRYGIAENDIKVKAKNIDKTLAKGNSAVIQVIFPGRSVHYLEDKSEDIIKNILSYIESDFVFVSPPKTENNKIMLTIRKKK